MHGYQGKILHVDLATSQHWEEHLPDALLTAFIGGIGLGAYLLHRECPPGADPLGAANPLIFVTSPFVGTAVTTSAKYAILAKSPLTGFIGDSLSGSHLAIELKRTGYDALLLHGACPEWRLLYVNHGQVELRDAEDLLGLDTLSIEAAVRQQCGPVRVAAIGPWPTARVSSESMLP